jgi:hypothetical protein
VQILINSVGIENIEAAEVHSRFIKELLKVLQDDLFASDTPVDPSSQIRKN